MTISIASAPVWDRTTRLWHWALAGSVTAGWLIGEFRSFSIMQWHFYAGYCTLALLAFRLGWGFLGPHPVRFSTLFSSLANIPRYIATLPERQPSGVAGHSPIGALASLAFLVVVLAQASTGLFAEDDGLFFAGPLSGEVDSDTVRQMTRWHNIGARAVLVMFCLHLAAMLFYRVWKRENLVTAMITGNKQVRKDPAAD